MSTTVSIAWTIIAQSEPRPVLNCSRCGGDRPFGSSGLFRLNANGKRLDAWLIYRCAACDNAWNRTIFERKPVGEIGPVLLAALHANDAALARRIAFDIDDLKRRARRIESGAPGRPVKRVLSGDPATALAIALQIEMATPVELRIDRLLATELGLSRAQISEATEQGRITMEPSQRRGLRAPAFDGMRIAIDLAAHGDRLRLARAAAGLPALPTPPACFIAACPR